MSVIVPLVVVSVLWAASVSALRLQTPGVQLWFLNPYQVGDIMQSLPLSQYMELSRPAPTFGSDGRTSQLYNGAHQQEVQVSQFHAQDGTGRAIFGYNTGDHARVEAWSAANGWVRGSYSYRDPFGKIIKVQYWDDGDGFHSTMGDGSAIQPVMETPEVTNAREEHEKLYAQAAQAAELAGNGGSEEPGQTRPQPDVPSVSGNGYSDLPPVYDTDGTELRRYPKLPYASLYDPTHIHDEERDAVVINNADDLDTYNNFNDIQYARRTILSPNRNRRDSETSSPDYVEQTPLDKRGDGFFYSFHHQAPLLVGVRPETASPDIQRYQLANRRPPLSVSEKAAYFGAIPLDAVHDVQSPPSRTRYQQSVYRPVYAEPDHQKRK